MELTESSCLSVKTAGNHGSIDTLPPFITSQEKHSHHIGQRLNMEKSAPPHGSGVPGILHPHKFIHQNKDVPVHKRDNHGDYPGKSQRFQSLEEMGELSGRGKKNEAEDRKIGLYKNIPEDS